jgi:PleD family two-component response regulator
MGTKLALIIVDHEDQAFYLENALKLAGIEPENISNGSAAHKRLAEFVPVLLV